MRNLHKIEGVTSWYDPRKYVASGEEDKFVIDYFKNKTNGFLLDIGAADGVTGSNSFRLFNEFDWSGIVVEPNPNHRNNLEKLFNHVEDISTCYNVVHETEKSVELFIHHGGKSGFTNINQRNGQDCATVEAKDINSMLEEFNCPHNIDYISMDIEGSEHHVLNHWNFDKYNVHLWCLEGNRFAQLMKSKGYKLLNTNGYTIKDSNKFWALT